MQGINEQESARVSAPEKASPEEENALVRGIIAGDSAALSTLWSAYGSRLHGYAASCLGGDEDLADDLTIQAVAAAARSIRGFNPKKGALISWLYGITRRMIRDEIRRQRRRGAFPLPPVSFDQLADSEAAAVSPDLTSRLDAQRKVRLLAATLTSDEMEALVLHLVHQFTAREIGGIMGRSGKAIDSLLHRARMKARERLAYDDK
jgi:RNA polymerase sigma factor (sigma-70 family)